MTVWGRTLALSTFYTTLRCGTAGTFEPEAIKAVPLGSPGWRGLDSKGLSLDRTLSY